ncbi:VOC family protein [Candidatus Saccharibacteria bacterium]|nr:VOC family protein [Candidatus Saccharibacteria bacterium]MCB9835057.1 VOC family protein [Candidatus Nomurabacteria bacterium]
MQKIIPNLWFDRNARQAVEYYKSIFDDLALTGSSQYPKSKDQLDLRKTSDTPGLPSEDSEILLSDGSDADASVTAEKVVLDFGGDPGDAGILSKSSQSLADFQTDLAGQDLTISISIYGYDFTLINAGPEFKATPSNSFMIYFNPTKPGQSKQDLTKIANRLLEKGTALMPLQEYDFSPWFAWIEDKYGFSWQLILIEPQDPEYPRIVPAWMFGGPVQNQAKSASSYYQSVFKHSSRGLEFSYPKATGPAQAGSIMYSDFKLENQWFAANDAGVNQDFSFTEAVSYQINCADQAEIDYYWSKLSNDPASEQCGWCKDRYGISWQIVPANIEKLMNQKKIIIDQYEQ